MHSWAKNVSYSYKMLNGNSPQMQGNISNTMLNTYKQHHKAVRFNIIRHDLHMFYIYDLNSQKII